MKQEQRRRNSGNEIRHHSEPRAYERPQLTRFGTIEELTQGPGNGDADVGYGSQPWL